MQEVFYWTEEEKKGLSDVHCMYIHCPTWAVIRVASSSHVHVIAATVCEGLCVDPIE